MSVFVVLGLIWAAVLVPPALRSRAERRAEFIDSFRQQMGALGGNAHATEVSAWAEPAARIGRPKRKVSPVQRRRDILGGLLGAMIGSALLGAVPSLRMVWVLHLFLVNLFIGYVALLAHQRGLGRKMNRAAAAPRLRVQAAPSGHGLRAVPAGPSWDGGRQARRRLALQPIPRSS